jgi:hypothetical protein
MKIFKFYKEKDGRWYVDLPEWPGEKEELEMVAGADKMLDYLSNNSESISLFISKDAIKDSDVLNLMQICKGGGALYSFNSEKDNPLWLCDVMKFVFNEFPEKLYLKTI